MKKLLCLSALIVYIFACCPCSTTSPPTPGPGTETPTVQPSPVPPEPTDTLAPPPPLTETAIPTDTPIPTATSQPMGGREVTEEEFGEDWPFTVERGFVDCTNLPGGLREAVFRADGVTYALNGTARSRAEAQGYEDIMESPIWRDDPNNPGAKINMSPILELALQECD